MTYRRYQAMNAIVAGKEKLRYLRRSSTKSLSRAILL
jgi:hypothetical protein